MKYEEIIKHRDKCLNCVWATKVETGRYGKKEIICWRTLCPRFKALSKLKELENENKSIN